jgi:protein involved in polysaccharide export with SLBB domain
MLRSSRLAVLAVVLIAATAPAAMASPGHVRTEQPVAKGDTLTVTVAQMPSFTLHAFETMPDSFAGIRYDVSVRAPADGAALWGERAQKKNQNAAFDHAFAEVMRHGTFAPDSFSCTS